MLHSVIFGQILMTAFKIPRSVLVLIHTPDLQFLLLKRAPKDVKGEFDVDFWQSVTGSLDALDEPPLLAAKRELFEETGLNADEYIFRDLQHAVEYEIFEQWRYRYAPCVTHNTEYQFAVCVPNTQVAVRLAPNEHVAYQWLPFAQAADLCFSWNNAGAIRRVAAELSEQKFD